MFKDLKEYFKENRERKHELALKDIKGYWKYCIVSDITTTIIISLFMTFIFILEIVLF